jgi:hypothetical protein
MEKDKLLSAEYLDMAVEMENDKMNGIPDIDSDVFCSLYDEAANLCPHPTVMRCEKLDTDEVIVEQCYECGNFFYRQKGE